VDTLSYKTLSAKPAEVVAKWHVIDATDIPVGRLSTQLVNILRGKHKTSYTPHVDCGDHVIVLNAEKVKFSGRKMQQKQYVTHSHYPGGQRLRTPLEVLASTHPGYIIETAVKGMLPKTTLGAQIFRKLHVYTGSTHKHQAQQPEVLEPVIRTYQQK
jgi:large subunit ribosomal protein L13